MDEFIKNTELDNIVETPESVNKELSSVIEQDRELELIREKELGGEEKTIVVEDENRKSNEDTDSQSASSSSASGAAAGGAAAAVAVVAVVVMIITGAVSNILAKFSKLDVYGTSFFFEFIVTMDYIETEDNLVDFENSDTGLVLVITKNKFSKTVNLKTDEPGLTCTVEKTLKKDSENEYTITMTFSGLIDGLEENTRYKLEVVGDEEGKSVSYLAEEIKTTGKITVFKNIYYRCTCSINGELSFNINFLDENNYYSDFTYQLVSPEGKVVKEGVIESPTEKQIITGVNELEGKYYTLLIKYNSTAQSDINAENKVSTFDGGKITIDKGKVEIALDVKL